MRVKVTDKKTKDGKVHLDVVALESDVKRAYDEAAIAFAQMMGLTPEANKSIESAAREQLGITNLDALIADTVSESLVFMALDRKGIIPMVTPMPANGARPIRGAEFKFELDVTPKPEFELDSYDPIELKLQGYSFDESAIDDELSRLSSSYTAYVEDTDSPEDREAAAGDYVRISLDVSKDGEEIPGLSASSRTYAVGAGHMPQGFDEQVIGMRANETKEFSFDAPAFDEDMKETSEKLDAKVKLIAFLKEESPEIDDAWVKANAPAYESLEGMKDAMRESMKAQGEKDYENYKLQLVAAEAAKRLEGQIADEAYESMMRKLTENLRQDVLRQGRTFEDFQEEVGGANQLNMMLMMQARDVLAQGYALDAVYRHFSLHATDDDYDEICTQMNSKVPPEELRRQIEDHSQGFALRESAERYRANKFLLENANIEMVS